MRKRRLPRITSFIATKWFRVSVIIVMGCAAVGGAYWLTYANSPPATTLQALADSQINIPYCSSDDKSQTFDFYRPTDKSDETIPLLIYIHGGGWRSGNKYNPLIETYGPLFLEYGIAVASLNYRLHTKYPYPDQNNDVACALSYLHDHADQLKIDSDKTLYFGDSAGGQLAAFAALNIPYKQYDYDAPIGVIDFYGVSDFSKIVDGALVDFNARRYLGSKYNQAAQSASPSTYVTSDAPRFLFIHGTRDQVVPISQSKGLYDLLVSSGIDAEYVAIPGAPHGFRGPELSQGNYRIIKESLASFLQDTLY